MEIKPLRYYKDPAYPEKKLVLRNPALLKTMPQRWKANAKIGIALTSLLTLMLTGCGGKDGQSGGENPQENGQDSMAGTFRTGQEAFPVSIPVFEHGDGRGSFGCVSVAPPAFLSEAEAFEIISEEAKKAGITFVEEGLELDHVQMPVTSLYYSPDEGHSENPGTREGSLLLDGYDESRRIAFEYISKDDVVAWQEENPAVMSSVESYDALGTAKRLKEELDGRKDPASVALFYDPMGFDSELYEQFNKEFSKISEGENLSDSEVNAKWTEIQQRYENVLKERKTEQLREQVKDFLEWMKAQGIL